MTLDRAYRLLQRKDINNKMMKSLEGTKRNNNEHAFDICSGEDISTTGIEEGSEHHITIRNKCPIGSKTVGNVHTHTNLSLSNNDTIPSSGDMMETIERNLDFVCVSGNNYNSGKPMVRCFGQNDIKSEINTVLGIKKWEPNESNIRKSSRLVTKRMMKEKDYLDKMSAKIEKI
jgi:hypothetical protein